jgi:putative DNA primase/helicase
MKTTEFIVGKEGQILSKYGLYVTGNRHIDCPICESKKSFRIHESEHGVSWICKCGYGSVIDLIMSMECKTFAEVCREIDEEYGNKSNFTPKTQRSPEKKFKSLPRIEKTQVESYLFSRGITKLPEHSVRYSEEYHKEAGETFGVMYAIASDERMKPAQVHLTYLKDGRKAGDPCRKMFAVTKAQNIAVKLFSSGSFLGIAEGIETALSAAQRDNVPVWATLNTSLMKRFRAPAGVKTLCIYADNDSHGAGLAAAFDCGNKNLLSKNDVSAVLIRWPKCGDWNDWIIEPGEHYEWQLKR